MQYDAMTVEPFLIAGGGIAGLAASLGLARAGRPSRLFEQAEAFAELGAGLQMSPNAVRALQHLGAWDAIMPHCYVPREIHIRDGLQGHLLQRVRLRQVFEQKFGAPYRVVHRADLLAGLLAAARQAPLISPTTGAQVASAWDLSSGASLVLDSGETIAGAAVIGADGIRSKVRAAFAPQIRPIPRGHTLYRGLMPITGVPPSIEAEVVTLWLLPGAHAVHYAVSAGRSFNIVVAVEEDWQSPGWSAPAAADDIRRRMGEVAAPLSDLFKAPAPWFKWMGADLDPLDRWQHRHIVLAGDAAHATLPYLAQGAAMALEDACVLGQAVAAEPNLPGAFARYADLRRARTHRIQQESRRNGAVYHARGALRLARNAGLRLMPEQAFLSRLCWIYDWQP